METTSLERWMMRLGVVVLGMVVAGITVWTYTILRPSSVVLSELSVLVVWSMVLPLVLAWQVNRAVNRVLRTHPPVEDSTRRVLARAHYWPIIVGFMSLGLTMHLLRIVAR